MSEEEIDTEVRKYFLELKSKIKNQDEIGKCVDKAIDLYFELKEKNKKQKQLEFNF